MSITHETKGVLRTRFSVTVKYSPPNTANGRGKKSAATPVCRSPQRSCSLSGMMDCAARSQSAIFGLNPKRAPSHCTLKLADGSMPVVPLDTFDPKARSMRFDRDGLRLFSFVIRSGFARAAPIQSDEKLKIRQTNMILRALGRQNFLWFDLLRTMA